MAVAKDLSVELELVAYIKALESVLASRVLSHEPELRHVEHRRCSARLCSRAKHYFPDRQVPPTAINESTLRLFA